MLDRIAVAWIRAVLIGIVVLAAFVALVVVLIEEPPDETITGRVTSVEPHDICVRNGVGRPTCAHVDAPQSLNGIEQGDCVRVTVSADEQLVDIVAAGACA